MCMQQLSSEWNRQSVLRSSWKGEMLWDIKVGENFLEGKDFGKKKGSNYYMGEEKSVGQKAKHMNMEF